MLSGGERQRLKLAIHMAEKGGIYVLDEPAMMEAGSCSRAHPPTLSPPVRPSPDSTSPNTWLWRRARTVPVSSFGDICSPSDDHRVGLLDAVATVVAPFLCEGYVGDPLEGIE